MARIPVERKEGKAWWLWLLGLVLLAGLIWLLVELFDDDEPDTAPIDDTTMVEPAAPDPVAAGAITSYAMIANTADRDALADREVDLAGLQVTDVVGDKVFYATPPNAATDHELLVFLAKV